MSSIPNQNRQSTTPDPISQLSEHLAEHVCPVPWCDITGKFHIGEAEHFSARIGVAANNPTTVDDGTGTQVPNRYFAGLIWNGAEDAEPLVEVADELGSLQALFTASEAARVGAALIRLAAAANGSAVLR